MFSEMYIQYTKYMKPHMDCTVFTHMHVQYIRMYVIVMYVLPKGACSRYKVLTDYLGLALGN